MTFSSRAACAALLLFTACASTQSGRRRPLGEHAAKPLAADAPIPEAMRVHVIDVGQGAATLFEFPCAAVLVDTGGEDSSAFDSDKALNDYLSNFFVRRSDLNRTFAAVFLTHPHVDHSRNLAGLMKRFTVLHLITNGAARMPSGAFFSGGQLQEDAEVLATGEKQFRMVRKFQVKPGGLSDDRIDPVSCGKVDPIITVLWGGMAENSEGWPPPVMSNANNHSLAVRVEVNGKSMLVTGDLEEAGLDAFLRLHEGTKALDVDVYQVGHHGSANGTTEALLTAMTPCIAVISMGDSARQEDWTAWEYGHPRKQVIDLLEKKLACGRPARTVPVATGKRRFYDRALERAIYGTGWDGTLWLELTRGGGWKVTTAK
jgi:competence protein ComEC